MPYAHPLDGIKVQYPKCRQIARSARHMAKCLLKMPKYLRQTMRLRFPKLVECSVCGWQGRQFVDNAWHKACQCPKCQADVRHRLLIAALDQLPAVPFEKLIRGKNILHFAPEWHIEKRLRKHAERYFSADLYNPRRDLQIDITRMVSIPDAVFDSVIACDVLEHVEDDHRAIREIARVLKPGGFAVLTVPQQDDLAVTFEDPSIVDGDERQRLFGQWDHVRIYGDDFVSRLEAANLDVTAISSRDFAEDLVLTHTLAPPILSPNPLATNFRKVFFAQKLQENSLRSTAAA
ncbi:MAG: class I SAM-dependent methyltransferase [Planctomycetota bacterium]|nr:class I SAM-dependent methyltransferase [Planctomycetota bacterium]